MLAGLTSFYHYKGRVIEGKHGDDHGDSNGWLMEIMGVVVGNHHFPVSTLINIQQVQL